MKKHPCTRDCPERTPGCNCQKRLDWIEYWDRIKKARFQDKEIDLYRRSSVQKSKKTSVRRRHRI